MGGWTIQNIFLIVIGAAIFVVGTTGLRRQIRIKLGNFIKQARIIDVNHITKKDDEGFLIQNYYDLKVEFEEDGKKQQKIVKSIDQYKKGSTIKVIKDNERGFRAYSDDKTPVFAPFILIVAGILIILMPFAHMYLGESYMSMLLAFLIMLVGIGLIIAYIKANSRQLEPLEAQIVDVLKWQSVQKKKWVNATFSYYPIIKYDLNNEQRFMRSRYNSNTPASYKVGKKFIIYKDINTGDIVEKGARKSMLFCGIFLIIFASVGLYSSLVVLFKPQ